jgi:hypothetical protein
MDEMLANVREAIQAWLEAKPAAETSVERSAPGRVVELNL